MPDEAARPRPVYSGPPPCRLCLGDTSGLWLWACCVYFVQFEGNSLTSPGFNFYFFIFSFLLFSLAFFMARQ